MSVEGVRDWHTQAIPTPEPFQVFPGQAKSSDTQKQRLRFWCKRKQICRKNESQFSLWIWPRSWEIYSCLSAEVNPNNNLPQFLDNANSLKLKLSWDWVSAASEARRRQTPPCESHLRCVCFCLIVVRTSISSLFTSLCILLYVLVEPMKFRSTVSRNYIFIAWHTFSSAFATQYMLHQYFFTGDTLLRIFGLQFEEYTCNFCQFFTIRCCRLKSKSGICPVGNSFPYPTGQLSHWCPERSFPTHLSNCILPFALTWWPLKLKSAQAPCLNFLDNLSEIGVCNWSSTLNEANTCNLWYTGGGGHATRKRGWYKFADLAWVRVWSSHSVPTGFCGRRERHLLQLLLGLQVCTAQKRTQPGFSACSLQFVLFPSDSDCAAFLSTNVQTQGKEHEAYDGQKTSVTSDYFVDPVHCWSSGSLSCKGKLTSNPCTHHMCSFALCHIKFSVLVPRGPKVPCISALNLWLRQRIKYQPRVYVFGESKRQRLITNSKMLNFVNLPASPTQSNLFGFGSMWVDLVWEKWKGRKLNIR